MPNSQDSRWPPFLSSGLNDWPNNQGLSAYDLLILVSLLSGVVSSFSESHFVAKPRLLILLMLLMPSAYIPAKVFVLSQKSALFPLRITPSQD